MTEPFHTEPSSLFTVLLYTSLYHTVHGSVFPLSVILNSQALLMREFCMLSKLQSYCIAKLIMQSPLSNTKWLWDNINMAVIWIINNYPLLSLEEPSLKAKILHILLCPSRQRKVTLVWVNVFLLVLFTCQWFLCWGCTLATLKVPSALSCVFASSASPSLEWEGFLFPCMHIQFPNPVHPDPSSTGAGLTLSLRC